MPVYWDETYKYLELCSEAFDRDFARWPIDKTRTREINKMRNWLMQRTLYLDSVIDGYPDGSK